MPGSQLRAPPQSQPLIMVFKKNLRTNEWYLYGFKKTATDLLRVIDEDKRGLSFHENIWKIESLQAQVKSASTQKTIEVNLYEDTYNQYVLGTFTAEFDEVEKENPTASNQDASEAAKETASLTTQLQAFMQGCQVTNQQMMREFQRTLDQVLTRKETHRMNINKFDGQNEDAKTWMTKYEKACDNNNWSTDDLRINNLGSNFVTGSAADKWYASRIIDEVEQSQDWSAWRQAFFAAFAQNRVQTATRALNWKYHNGNVMEYFYEKERLLKIAFPDIGIETFISLVLCGLPQNLQSIALTIDPQDKTSLIQCLQKLPYIPKQSRTDTRNEGHREQSSPKQSLQKNDKYALKDSANRNNPSNKEANKHHGKVNQVTEIKETPSSISNVVCVPEKTQDLDIIPLKINGIEVMTMLDTGSQVNLLSTELAREQGWNSESTKLETEGFNNTRSVLTKFVHVNLSGLFKGKTLKPTAANCYLYDDLAYGCILSNRTLKEMGISLTAKSVGLVTGLPTQSVGSLEEAKKLFPDLVKPPVKPQYSVPFILNVGSPVFAAKPYRLSRSKYQWALDKIEDLKAKGYVRDSNSRRAVPIVIVPKDEEGKEFRFCCDYRAINVDTPMYPFPFPVIDDVIINLGGCQFFSKIDLKDAFHSIGLTEETRCESAFVTPFGLFEWNVLPFGWKRSPPVFQQYMVNHVLTDLLRDRRISVYIDDIIIGAKTKEECKEITFLVLERLNKHGLRINEKKCEFVVPQVIFLGRQINGQTRTTKQESVDKVRNMAPPHDVHSLRVFTGLTGHFQHYIKNYSGIVRPLNRLKKKEVEWNFDEQCMRAFTLLIDEITRNPILCLPDWTLPFELCTDASHLGCGAVLYQRDQSRDKKHQLRVIGYYSYTFSPPEINYNVTEKECLAGIKAIKYFRSYLEGRSFDLYTDHQALTSLLSMKEPKGRLARWQILLMTFDMKINHRKGNNLQDADALSRLCLDNPALLVCNIVHLCSNETVLDDSSKSLILKRYHDDADSGAHDGWFRTFMKIRKRFNWKNMLKEIKEYVSNCHVCQITKFKYRPKYDSMILPPHSKVVHETLHLDYGELNKRSEGIGKTRSFILAVDESSRMTYTKPLNQKAKSLVLWLESLPFFKEIKKIITDNGPSFTSDEFGKFCSKNNIAHYLTSPYHPAANGMAERKVRDIKTFFALYPNFKNGWKKCLEAATNHQNRSYNKSLGCSPLFKLTGRSVIFPADNEFGIAREVIGMETPFTQQRIDADRKKLQEYFNAKHRSNVDIKEGDQVLFQAGMNGKNPKVIGPVDVKGVIEKDSKLKTILYEDEYGKTKPLALKNVIKYNKRPPLSILAVTLLAMSCLMLPVDSLFPKESPVIWLKSNIPVTEKLMNIKHSIVLSSLCAPIDDAVFLTISQRQTLNLWCSKRAAKVFKPLEDVCQKESHILGQNQNGLIRKEREIVTAFVLASLFTILASVGISSFFYIENEAIREQESKINILKSQNMRTSERFLEFLRDAENVTMRLELLEQRVDFLERHSPQMSMFIADTTTSFDQWESLTNDIARLAPKKELPASLFRLVRTVDNFHEGDQKSDQFPRNAILQQALLQYCSVNTTTGSFDLHYQIPIEKNDSFIYEAFPFPMQRNITDSQTNVTETCLTRYIGPKYVMVTPKCIHVLSAPLNVIGKFTFIYDDALLCVNTSSNHDEYWTLDKSSCVDYKQADQFPAITLTDTTGSHIYCPGKKILLTSHSYDCPNHVFKLPVSQKFTVDNFHYSPHIFSIKNDNFSLDYHLKITSHVYPNVHTDPLLADLKSVEEEIKNEPSFEFEDKFYHPTVITVVLLVILILLLLGLLIYRRSKPRTLVIHKRRQGKEENNNDRPENLELQSIGGYIDE